MNVAYNMDCMDAMREMPDNTFDLAVVDPPYGDGIDGGNPERFGQRFHRYIEIGGGVSRKCSVVEDGKSSAKKWLRGI